MQRDFDEAQRLRRANLSTAPTKSAPIPTAQPTPMGAAPAPQQRQEVPKADKAADFAKTQKGAEIIARQAPKAAPDNLRTKAPDAYRPQSAAPAKSSPATPPPARNIWGKAATPTPAPRDDKKQEMRDIWSGAAKPKPAPNRSRGRDQDHEPEM